MPLEAIQQIADKERQIESIQLRDVRITKAVVVPDDQLGIESFLQLRPQRTGTSGPSTGWWEFSVVSGLEDQHIEENAFGLIKVNYKSDESGPGITGKGLLHAALKREYESAKSLCTRKIDPEDFYKRTADAGLAYGPNFQGLTEISSGKGRCCCVINIPDTKSVMPSNIESEHLIHPTTLDIIFHSLFAALGDEELEFETAAVPISFDSLTLSMDLPSGATAQFSGFCHATRAGPREVIADVYMSNVIWDEPKVQIKGIRCRELPRTDVSSSADGSVKAPFGTLLWKPDLTLLDYVSLEDYIIASNSAQRFVRGTNPQNPSALPNGTGKHPKGSDAKVCEVRYYDLDSTNMPIYLLHQIVDLAAHKNPDLRILQVGVGVTGFTASVLSILQQSPTATPRFSNYTLADSDKVALEAAEARLQDWESLMTFSTLSPDLDLQEHELQETSFDVIIVAVDFSDNTTRETLFRNAQRLLCETGYLLILGTTMENVLL
jgi:zearalenone synthase (highly reducing iterative type I polyketide synthase)